MVHDTLDGFDPLLVELRGIYGDDNVMLESRSSVGIQYILDHLADPLIVILDFDLGPGEPLAPVVLERIRQVTSLVYVIIWTAKQTSSISVEDLVNIINNDAMAFLKTTADTDEILEVVRRAAVALETRIDCLLEQWISRRSESERRKPIIKDPNGRMLSLDDLMVEIRTQTEVGVSIRKGILRIAIDLITKGAEGV
jgi:DNA-binding NtrC family response regulator